MNKNIVKTNINVMNNKINIIRVGNDEYISLTDLARYADSDEPRLPIRDWMRNKEVISFLGLWESLNNENFKGGEFDTFKNKVNNEPKLPIYNSELVILIKNSLLHTSKLLVSLIKGITSFLASS